MKKKTLKNLNLKKSTISNLNLTKISGGIKGGVSGNEMIICPSRRNSCDCPTEQNQEFPSGTGV
ncbi:hypothetical protein [Aquimarina rubra]|uniref:Bacteriocin n=1 Tax=Aquimarina rubra TaxID=1920033 RepID=A0ABW5LLF6_9FLAO